MTQEELDALMKIGEELENEQNAAENLAENTKNATANLASENSTPNLDENATQLSLREVEQGETSKQSTSQNLTQNSTENGKVVDYFEADASRNDGVEANSSTNSSVNSNANSADNATANSANSSTNSSANSAEISANSAANSSPNSTPNPDTINIFAPPTNNEHKVVHQLDEVTRDSEIKAVEMMDRLENLGKLFSHSEISLQKIREDLEKMGEVFEILCTKFPHINTFKDLQERQKSSIKESDEIFSRFSKGQDGIFEAMDAMQYQDIHRQKIERAINVMRALNRYMNSLFEGSVDDSKRVASATYIAGDSQNAMSDDDIEDLIASLRAK